MKKTRQKPKCSKGYGCGNSCINSKLICRGEVPDEFMERFTAAVKAAKAAGKSNVPDLEVAKPSDLTVESPAALVDRAAEWTQASFGDGAGNLHMHDLEHIGFHNSTGISSSYIKERLSVTDSNFLAEEMLIDKVVRYLGNPADPKDKRRSQIDKDELYGELRNSVLASNKPSVLELMSMPNATSEQQDSFIKEVVDKLAAADLDKTYYMVAPGDSKRSAAISAEIDRRQDPNKKDIA